MSYYVGRCSGCNDEFGNLVVVSNNGPARCRVVSCFHVVPECFLITVLLLDDKNTRGAG